MTHSISPRPLPGKLVSLTLACTALLACHSDGNQGGPPPPVATSSAREVFDLSACAGPAITAEEFLKRCQAVTQVNFTYSADLAHELAAQEASFDGPTSLASGELEPYLVTQLTRCGLACKPIGPSNLRIFLVERGS